MSCVGQRCQEVVFAQPVGPLSAVYVRRGDVINRAYAALQIDAAPHPYRHLMLRTSWRTVVQALHLLIAALWLQLMWETEMAWKAPKIVEVAVGMEINMYACAARK